MKKYKIYYTESGTVYNYCKAWVTAENEEEAKEALIKGDWDKILETEEIDAGYGDDYRVTEIDSVELIAPYED